MCVCLACSPFTLPSMQQGFDRNPLCPYYKQIEIWIWVFLCTLLNPQLHCTGGGFPKWERFASWDFAATVPSSHLSSIYAPSTPTHTHHLQHPPPTYPNPLQTLDITTFSLHSHHISTYPCILSYTHAYNIIRKHNPPIGGMGLRYTHSQHQ